MKASDFSYECPSSLTEALGLLAEADIDTRALAGGQSLMPMMNFRLAQPERLLDLNRIEELRFIRETHDAVEIGAMTRMAELEQSALVSAHQPLIAKALPFIAHPAIRNRGTVGGSLALADPAAEMPAIALALDARIHVASRDGSRIIASQDCFLGPYETALADDELIELISFPKATPDQKVAFYEIARRHGDYAMAGVSVALRGQSAISDARVAFFGISDRAVRAEACETALVGQALSDQAAIAAAVEQVGQLSCFGDLHADVGTKQHLARVVLKRALAELGP